MKGREILLLTLAAAACGDPGSAPRLEIAVSPTPAAVGVAQVRVSVADTAGLPSSPIVVTGRPEGAAAPAVVDTAAATRPGLWVADSFPFPEAGAWILEARIRLADGRTLEGSHPIHVVGR